MSETSELQPVVVRNERGLSIHGTRITLYDVMDYLQARLSPEEIQEWLPLTGPQIAAAVEYITAHRAEVDAEYRQVLAQMDGEGSLEQTLREENPSTSLPVVTVGRIDSLRESAYRARCARRLVEIALYMERYRGAGRLFIP